MRKIKFRAWNTIETRWVDSDEIPMTGDPEPILELSGRNYLQLSQFTGLKDSKGIEIYEGDIVIAPTFMGGQLHKGVIVYKTVNAAFKIEPILKKSYKNDRMLFYKSYKTEIKCEVIGNIYENKDLLTPLPDEISDRKGTDAPDCGSYL
jgi:hypothetical protein